MNLSEQIIFDIYETYNKRDEKREHLGASQIGKQCVRSLWYSFRWITSKKESSIVEEIMESNRIKKLFERGNREEEIMINDLKKAGYQVINEQFSYTSKTHKTFKGSIDGVLIDKNSKKHILELKTSNKNRFNALQKHGVQKSNPEHFAQMQLYMAWSKIDSAIYLAVCKDNDKLYCEEVPFLSFDFVDQLEKKAELILKTSTPGDKISDKNDFYLCRFCDHKEACHDNKIPEINCRTCAFSTLDKKENEWICEKTNTKLSTAMQIQACDSHYYIPTLLPPHFKAGRDKGSFVYYNKETSEVIKSSKELFSKNKN